MKGGFKVLVGFLVSFKAYTVTSMVQKMEFFNIDNVYDILFSVTDCFT